MQVKMVLPYKTILDIPCMKITAPGQGGMFQILPRHVDLTWTLVPGILEIQDLQEKILYYAVNKGVLVKVGPQVMISTFQAIQGESLEALHQAVQENFIKLSEREREAQLLLAKLESDTIKRFMELEK